MYVYLPSYLYLVDTPLVKEAVWQKRTALCWGARGLSGQCPTFSRLAARTQHQINPLLGLSVISKRTTTHHQTIGLLEKNRSGSLLSLHVCPSSLVVEVTQCLFDLSRAPTYLLSRYLLPDTCDLFGVQQRAACKSAFLLIDNKKKLSFSLL